MNNLVGLQYQIEEIKNTMRMITDSLAELHNRMDIEIEIRRTFMKDYNGRLSVVESVVENMREI